jgi:hypothetical protein
MLLAWLPEAEATTHIDYERKNMVEIQGLLPIALDLFSIESQAEEIDTWLNTVIDSEILLSEYVDLMAFRQNENYSFQVLEYIFSWYITFQTKVSYLSL